ncbi:probable RAD50-DNA repair protein [Serendipita indica DSM 11827]|uniref:DNA repair protein RAD50 n=1 Tax=Serendipita indica (strain DSM 11827) TaxID=1109443 RepID=G4U324_SERID|nr:probable RAD50-DNA repair protein [Serendipita indica DSM 11827]
MAAEKEVKAQVRLRFKAANGNTMMVTRNLSVTQKKTTGMTMKTLEAVLTALPKEGEPEGKRHTISTRCADMDAEIPNLLGVSKAVLDNVIFCHQEDSYWPLSEPSILKKKFDEIFEASKYTKALDAIRAIRKDRVVELKLDNERLQAAAREKTHADKLRNRIADLNATVTAKDSEYNEVHDKASALAHQNKEFYERATQFREIYREYEAAQEKRAYLEKTLKEINENLEKLDGTDAELEERRANFDQEVQVRKMTCDRKARDLRDEEERLKDVRRLLGEEQTRLGQLQAEKQAYNRNLTRRDNFVRELSGKYGIKGFDSDSLDQRQWLDFRTRMDDLHRRTLSQFEAMQAEGRVKDNEYNENIRKLQADIAKIQAERDSMAKLVNERQHAVKDAEAQIDSIQTKNSEFKGVTGEIEQKMKRIQTLQEELDASNYDAQLEQKSAAIHDLNRHYDRLNDELASSTLQMENRTTLSLRRDEAQKYELEIQTIFESISGRFHQAVGRKPQVESIERDIDRSISEKEREIKDLEVEVNGSSRRVAQIESTISTLKSRQKQLEDEAKTLDKKLTSIRGEHPSVNAGLIDAQEQLNLCQDEIAKHIDSSRWYNEILKAGRTRKLCTSCNRPITDDEMAAFEQHVSNLLKKDSSAKRAELEDELTQWQAELSRMQLALPLEVNWEKMKKTEIPKLIQEHTKLQETLNDAILEATACTERLDTAKLSLKTLQSLKQQVNNIVGATQRRDIALQQVKNLEETLRAGATMKSLDEIQAELSTIQQGIERERQMLQSDRERHSSSIRILQTELYQLQIRERELRTEIQEGKRLEELTATYTEEIKKSRMKIKDLDAQLARANEPVDALVREQEKHHSLHKARVNEAQEAIQAIKSDLDRLDLAAGTIEEYLRNQGPRNLKRCQEAVVDLEEAIRTGIQDIEALRAEVGRLTKEVASSSLTASTLKDNLRARALAREIAQIDARTAALDLEEASRARQQFDEKYNRAKAAEDDAYRQSQRLVGELTSLRNQLTGLERDMREYKDASRKYTEQLIKTKMADMVNNDLEKYAKALDSAIMKYHSVKMAEVNDTMRYLWNRTYQGTDIDGIKIISEGEGGGSGRRNYNYRVVMVKDQVEMDMRGRCSAGQKMLASIIIRLALSDSFGANCGVLALDEPTNALDVDNIEALAQSLVDIIRERRTQANFQLIIITHDENFLRKLGEASVIDYYWRVSRDGRQKSTVEKNAINL